MTSNQANFLQLPLKILRLSPTANNLVLFVSLMYQLKQSVKIVPVLLDQIVVSGGRRKSMKGLIGQSTWIRLLIPSIMS